MKEIKTKSTMKDIKTLDKAADVSRRAKNAYIRTKEQVERLGHNDDGNYVDDAGNSVRKGAEMAARKAGHTAGNYGKNAVEKIKERRAPGADTPRSDTPNGEYARQAPKTEASPRAEQKAAPSEARETIRQKITQ